MKVSKSAIFLFELMVVILIFSVAAAICANIFGDAYKFSEDSKALTMAVIKSESIAEEFKAEGKAPSGDLLFDADWNPVAEKKLDDALYFIRTEVEKDGAMSVMDIAVKKMGSRGIGPQDVYTLKVKSYG
jgi:Tfp pilus assembly protein PilE